MRFITRIDDFLIDRIYQPIVNLFSRWWGIGFIPLGEFLLTGGFMCWFFTPFFNNKIMDAFRDGRFIVAASVITLWFLGGTMMIFVVFDQIKHARAVQREGFINPLRFYLSYLRMTNVATSIFIWLPSVVDDQTYGIIQRSFVVLLISGLYIMSCNEGPPKQRSHVAAPLETTV